MRTTEKSSGLVASQAHHWVATWQQRSHLRRVESLCRKEIAALRLPAEIISVHEVAEYVSLTRNRPLHLVAAPLTRHKVFGLWAMLEQEDVVLYERDTTRAHQEHIIAHEIGHIVFNHPGDRVTTSLPFEHISSALVERVLHRCGIQETHEVEAEVFADLLSTFACSRPSRRGHTDSTDPLRSIFRSLGGT